ncbi:MAG: MmcQ-like protein [Flavobacterium psychrophilum]|nr:MAG: MmcQ-like protein [Flavobacterium psychrophilum]
MFALSSLSQWEKGEASVNLKCDPDRALELRAQHEAIEPGYHMSKVHWNTITVDGDVPEKMLRELIDHSYELVFKSLTKKLQSEILEQQ